MFFLKAGKKVQHIIDIWKDGFGVVSLHCFQSVIPVEAYTREACMVDAIGKWSCTLSYLALFELHFSLRKRRFLIWNLTCQIDLAKHKQFLLFSVLWITVISHFNSLMPKFHHMLQSTSWEGFNFTLKENCTLIWQRTSSGCERKNNFQDGLILW